MVAVVVGEEVGEKKKQEVEEELDSGLRMRPVSRRTPAPLK